MSWKLILSPNIEILKAPILKYSIVFCFGPGKLDTIRLSSLSSPGNDCESGPNKNKTKPRTIIDIRTLQSHQIFPGSYKKNYAKLKLKTTTTYIFIKNSEVRPRGGSFQIGLFHILNKYIKCSNSEVLLLTNTTQRVFEFHYQQ